VWIGDGWLKRKEKGRLVAAPCVTRDQTQPMRRAV
jgi:hypothetical protein